MGKHFSFPEIPHLDENQLEKECEDNYAISISAETLQCLLIAVAKIITLKERTPEFEAKTKTMRWRIVLGHISKVLKLGFSLLKIARTNNHREGINQLAIQIFDVCVQALWLCLAEDEKIDNYVHNSFVEEKINYDRVNNFATEGQKKYVNEKFPEMFSSAGLDINKFEAKYKKNYTVDEMIKELKLSSKYHALYDVLGFHQTATTYRDLTSFYLEEKDGQYRPSLSQATAKPYYISGGCRFLLPLVREYVNLTFTGDEVKAEINEYFNQYEKWTDQLIEYTMFRPFNKKPSNATEQKMENNKNSSSLSSHKLIKKELVAPLKQIDFTMKSWFNDRIPEMLWALCLYHGLGRIHTLDLFRKIINLYMTKQDSSGEITFSGIALLDKQTKDEIFEIFRKTPHALMYLSNLKVIQNIPGIEEWPLEEINDKDAAWSFLAHAIFLGTDHQSQEATDCRWLRFACMVAVGKLHLQTKEQYDEIFGYPNIGDQRKVRPFIRSGELMFDATDGGNNSVDWTKDFWENCFKDTTCIPKEAQIPTQKLNPSMLDSKNLQFLFRRLSLSYMKTIPSTRADAKHEVAWGLALYAAGIVMQTVDSSDDDVLGLFSLRTVAEVAINLNYLIKRNDVELWLKFRDYGTGKAKQTLLKAEEDETPAHYIPVEQLRLISNEDKWQEFVNIGIGDWSGESLRDRAVKYDFKEIYDMYYEWPSSFSHGQWSAIRFLVFGNCINPLHRFHRTPKLPGMVRTVKYDLEILLNIILGMINSEYPPEGDGSKLELVKID